MSESELSLCRLCMGTEVLSHLYKMDVDISLDIKISSCINIKVHPRDGLSSLICKICEKNIKTFYDFKQRCLEVDSKLRSMKNCSKTRLDYLDSDLDNIKLDIKMECEFINKLDSDFKDTLDSWLTDDTKSELNIEYLNKEITVDIEQIESSPNEILHDKTKKIEATVKPSKLKNKVKINDSFQCELCGHIFKIRAALEKHLLSHSGIKLFTCTFCPKSFTRAEHRVVHLRSHMGIRPYICEICGRSSTKRQDLLRHMRIHSEEKKYACPRCGRRFKRSSDVCSHMRTHTGVRPFVCSICEKDYTSHSGLRKHYKTHCKKELYDTK